MIAWGVIKAFGLKNWVNILKYGAIAAVVATVWWKADTAWDNYKQAIENERVEYAQSQVDLLAVGIERDRAVQAIGLLLQQREMLAELVEDQLVEQEKIRQEAADRIAVFEGHDLEKIAKSNHNVWLGKLATTATNNYFEELQNAFNY